MYNGTVYILVCYYNNTSAYVIPDNISTFTFYNNKYGI